MTLSRAIPMQARKSSTADSTRGDTVPCPRRLALVTRVSTVGTAKTVDGDWAELFAEGKFDSCDDKDIEAERL